MTHPPTPENVQRFLSGGLRRITCPRCRGTCLVDAPSAGGFTGKGLIECGYCAFKQPFTVDVSGVVSFMDSLNAARGGGDDGLRGGAPKCNVKDCKRRTRDESGLCGAHHRAWKQMGRPPMEEWIKTTRVERRQAARAATKLPPPPPKPCLIKGCNEFGMKSKGLCRMHYERYMRCGYPDMAHWVNAGGPTPTDYGATRGELRVRTQWGHCNVPDCRRPRTSCAKHFCSLHQRRYVDCGEPGVQDWIDAGGPKVSQWRNRNRNRKRLKTQEAA